MVNSNCKRRHLLLLLLMMMMMMMLLLLLHACVALPAQLTSDFTAETTVSNLPPHWGAHCIGVLIRGLGLYLSFLDPSLSKMYTEQRLDKLLLARASRYLVYSLQALSATLCSRQGYNDYLLPDAPTVTIHAPPVPPACILADGHHEVA